MNIELMLVNYLQPMTVWVPIQSQQGDLTEGHTQKWVMCPKFL